MQKQIKKIYPRYCGSINSKQVTVDIGITPNRAIGLEKGPNGGGHPLKNKIFHSAKIWKCNIFTNSEDKFGLNTTCALKAIMAPTVMKWPNLKQ